MREVSRRGVAIDVCPECKGVWLDRGELDKLIEVAEQEEIAVERSPVRSRRDEDDDDDRRRTSNSDDQDRGRYEDDRGRGSAPRTKKKGWLSQMMEAVGGEGVDD
jgi:Zn-finger nucleic acid-binding protein